MTRAVRKPLRIKPQSRRTLEERLIIRFPRGYALLARAIFRLPPASRIRQAFVWRGVELGIAATNRRDFEAVLPRYDPDVVFVPAREMVTLGVANMYRGRQGYVQFWDDWDEVWSSHARYESAVLVDLGHCLVGLLRVSGVGGASGVAVEMDGTFVWTLKDGRVIKEEHHAGTDLDSILERLG